MLARSAVEAEALHKSLKRLGGEARVDRAGTTRRRILVVDVADQPAADQVCQTVVA